MDEHQLREIRLRVMAMVASARANVGALQATIDGIMSNTERLTPEARRSDAAVALAEARSRIMATLQEDAPRVVAGAVAEVDSTLVRLTEVRPGEMDASARDLRPVLDLAVTRAAAGEPELLVNLARFAEDDAARRVVERAAVALVGALGGTDNYQTRNAWDAVQEELAAARGPEELAALDARSELDDLAAYVASSATLVSLDLSLLDPSITDERQDALAVQRAMSEAQVNEYESKHASGVLA